MSVKDSGDRSHYKPRVYKSETHPIYLTGVNISKLRKLSMILARDQTLHSGPLARKTRRSLDWLGNTDRCNPNDIEEFASPKALHYDYASGSRAGIYTALARNSHHVLSAIRAISDSTSPMSYGLDQPFSRSITRVEKNSHQGPQVTRRPGYVIIPTNLTPSVTLPQYSIVPPRASSRSLAGEGQSGVKAEWNQRWIIMSLGTLSSEQRRRNDPVGQARPAHIESRTDPEMAASVPNSYTAAPPGDLTQRASQLSSDVLQRRTGYIDIRDSGEQSSVGDLYLDGGQLGIWMTRYLERGLGRPASGASSLNTRVTAPWPGSPIT
jgi:hypothetical protein